MKHAVNEDRKVMTSASGLFSAVAGAVVGFVKRTYVRHSVYNRLSSLSDRMLADIGLTRGDIARIAEEAARNAAVGQMVPSDSRLAGSANLVEFPENREGNGNAVANDDRRVAA